MPDKPVSEVNDQYTEIVLPYGIHIKTNWKKSELNIKINGKNIKVSSSSKHVVINEKVEYNEN